MKILKLVALVFGVVFLGLCSLIIVMVQPKPCIITGNYINTTGIVLQDVGVTIKIIQNGILKNKYRTMLNKDGFFRVKVEERGLCHVLVHRFSYITPPLFNPIVSNKYLKHPCRLEEGEVVNIGTHYLFEALKIISPLNKSTCADLDDLYFEWEEVPFANLYDLEIRKIVNMDEYKSKLIIRSILVDTKISYSDLQALIKVDENADDLIATKLQSFNTAFQNLDPGCYAMYVNAYKYDTETNKATFICESNKVALNFWFRIN